MHPGNMHFGIKPYASEILAKEIDKYGLSFGTAYGGITTLYNGNCTLLLVDVEGAVVLQFSVAGDEDTRYNPFTYLNALVPGGASQHPLIAFEKAPGEERIKIELDRIRQVLSSGAFDPVLHGEKEWISAYLSFEAEYERLDTLRYLPPLLGHPEEVAIRKKKGSYDLTWMDDVRRILAEQESQS